MAEIRPPLTAGEVAGIIGVSRFAVLNWIKQGLLEAYATPGNHHRVLPSKLVDFLQKHGMPIPDELRPPASPTVLIADDEEAVREVSRRALAKDGYRIIEAADGYEACIKIGELKPEVVLLDLMMPHMDGFEVCRRIKSNPGTQACRVLAITGYASEENVRKIRDCGAEDVLIKPIDINDLRQRVREMTKTR